jgi:putative membrane protein
MRRAVLAVTFACLAATPALAAVATPQDRAFVAKVSQGGMFEVAAGKLAADKASAQDVRDFAVMEVHDHTLVGDKLKDTAGQSGISFSTQPNAAFSAKMAHLKTLSGPAFDDAYMSEMATLHAGDGAAFAKEGLDGGSPALRAFGLETAKIVKRHIGAIHAATPPAR